LDRRLFTANLFSTSCRMESSVNYVVNALEISRAVRHVLQCFYNHMYQNVVAYTVGTSLLSNRTSFSTILISTPRFRQLLLYSELFQVLSLLLPVAMPHLHFLLGFNQEFTLRNPENRNSSTHIFKLCAAMCSVLCALCCVVLCVQCYRLCALCCVLCALLCSVLRVLCVQCHRLCALCSLWAFCAMGSRRSVLWALDVLGSVLCALCYALCALCCGLWAVLCTLCSVLWAVGCAQHARSTQHTAHGMRQTACSMQHTACSIQHTAHGTRYAACSMQHTAHGVQHTAHSTQHTAHSTQHTAHGTQQTAHGVQRMRSVLCCAMCAML
jgi:hypothetical protein